MESPIQRFMRYRIRISALMGLLMAGVALLFVRGPIPQSAAYWQFADQREIAGIPHFWDVFSNVPFLLIGLAGVFVLWSGRAKGVLPALRPAYYAFFAGSALIGLGSAFFHIEPNRWTLVWDRAPMTIAFMAFVAIVFGEHLGWLGGRKNLGARLLWPLIGFGLLSVVYWAVSESRGAGDLRLYAISQFGPMLLLPFVLAWFPSLFGSARYYWGVLGSYALAKVLELADHPIYGALGQSLSGHTLKHLVAALATGCVLLAVLRRPSPEGRRW